MHHRELGHRCRRGGCPVPSGRLVQCGGQHLCVAVNVVILCFHGLGKLATSKSLRAADRRRRWIRCRWSDRMSRLSGRQAARKHRRSRTLLGVPDPFEIAFRAYRVRRGAAIRKWRRFDRESVYVECGSWCGSRGLLQLFAGVGKRCSVQGSYGGRHRCFRLLTLLSESDLCTRHRPAYRMLTSSQSASRGRHRSARILFLKHELYLCALAPGARSFPSEATRATRPCLRW